MAAALAAASSRRSSSRSSSRDGALFSNHQTPTARYSSQYRAASIAAKSNENLSSLFRMSHENLLLLSPFAVPMTPLLRPTQRNASWDDLDQSLINLDEHSDTHLTIDTRHRRASQERTQILSTLADGMGKEKCSTDPMHRQPGRSLRSSLVWPLHHQWMASHSEQDVGTSGVNLDEANADEGDIDTVDEAVEHQWQEPLEFTARDIIALERIQRRLHRKEKNQRNHLNHVHGFRVSREQMMDRDVAITRKLSARTEATT